MKSKEYSKNLQILFESLLPYLSLEDLKTCRQLNSTWKYITETAVRFARICNDSTISQLSKDIPDSQISIRVENLVKPITDEHISFAPKVTLLFLEPFPVSQSGSSHKKSENTCTQADSEPTVSFPNFMKLLWSCTNVQRLILNQGALAHPQLDGTCFQGLAKKLIHLKHLGVILTGNSELQSLRYIFGETFPRLEFLSVCYHKIRNAPNLESYVEILMFILKHKDTLRDIVLSDPPMVPTQIEQSPVLKKTKKRKKLKSISQSAPTTFQEYLTHFRKQFETLKLHGVGLKFTENQFSCWGLGMTMLENRKNLVLIYLSRIPAVVVEKLAWENSATLQVLNLKGIAYQMRPELSKVFNCACLSRCSNLCELEISDFYSYRHIEQIPFRKLKILQLLTYMGSDSKYGAEPLCSYESAVIMAEELRVAEKVILFRSNMMTCDLTSKICKLETLQEITLLGFRGKYFNNERVHLLYEKRWQQQTDFMEPELKHRPSNYGDGIPFCIYNSPADVDELHKICSGSSLCPSCVRIVFPKGPKTRWDKLHPSIRYQILFYLSAEDLRAARLVSRAWCQDALEFLQYGLCLSDKTKDFICETSLTSIVYLAVANLKSLIPYETLYFARFVQTLVLEYNEESFTKANRSNVALDPNNDILNSFPQEMLAIEKAFGVSKGPSIHSRNIINLLETCFNLETLFINQWALSNFLGQNRSTLKFKDFQRLGYRNLRCLHLVIHTSEVEAMLQFLNLEFNSKVIDLEKFCIQFVGSIKSRSMTEVYESIFKFIGFQNKLTDLKIVDPIFASDAFKGRGDAEPALSTASDKCRCGCIKILQASAHLKKLKVAFKEIPTKWNLGFIYLRSQKFLKEIWLEGLPVNEVHTVILNSATTLESIYVYWQSACKKRSCFDFSYTKNCHKLRRLVVRNIDAENAQEIPEGVRILEINGSNGKSVGWNISPTLSRVKGRVTVSTKVARIFLKQFELLECIALINVGFLGLELTKIFLKLPNLKLLVASHIAQDVLPELKTIPGIQVENCNTSQESLVGPKPTINVGSCGEGIKITVQRKCE